MEPLAIRAVRPKRTLNRRDTRLYPRLIPEVVTVRAGDAVVIEGARTPIMLTSQNGPEWLENLMRMLDGAHDIKAIERKLRCVESHAANVAIAQLRDCGLIDDRECLPDRAGADDAFAFYRRLTVGVNSARCQPDAAVRSATIAIVTTACNRWYGSLLQRLLANAGMHRTLILDDGTGVERHLSTLDPEWLLVSLTVGSDGDDADQRTAIERWRRLRPRRWLRAHYDETVGYADVGPLFVSGITGCWDCFAQIHQNTIRRTPRSATSKARMTTWVSLVAAELALITTGLGEGIGDGVCRRHHMDHWNWHTVRVFKVPGCVGCQQSALSCDAPTSRTAERAQVFEQIVMLPGAFRERRDEQYEVRPAWRNAGKELPFCRHVPLTDFVQSDRMPDEDRSSAADPVAAVTIRRLALALKWAAGLRDQVDHGPFSKRYAATAGNLGSVELFVVAVAVDGLPPSVYLYQPADDSLAALESRSGSPDVTTLMSVATGCHLSALPDAVVLLTGSLKQVSRKYGPFGYRLIYLDAGVALNQLFMSAGRLGMAASSASQWADDLIERACYLDPPGEQVTAVLGLSGGRTNGGLLAGPVPAITPHRRDSPLAIERFCDVSLWRHCDALYEEGRLPYDALLSGTRFAAIRPFLMESDIAPGGGFDRFIRTRRTVRSYCARPVTAADVTLLMTRVLECDREQAPSDAAKQRIQVTVVVRRVTGITPGVYKACASHPYLSEAGRGLSEQDAAKLFVQREFDSAPLHLWISGDVMSECEAQGARGYRRLLVRVGAIAQSITYFASAIGLDSAIVAGIDPRWASRVLGCDAHKQVPIAAVTVGYSVDS